MEESGSFVKSLLTLLIVAGIAAVFILPRDLSTLGGGGATRSAVAESSSDEAVLADTDVPAPAAAEAEQQASDIRYTTARALNMRAAPSTNGAVVASLPLGTRVSVGDTEGRWLFVETDTGEAGWISSRFATADPPAR